MMPAIYDIAILNELKIPTPVPREIQLLFSVLPNAHTIDLVKTPFIKSQDIVYQSLWF
jgi:hypothetical protein